MAVDTTGDGQADAVGFDTTGDGKADAVMVDSTGDSKLDMLMPLSQLAAGFAKVEREHHQRKHLANESFRGGNADFGAGIEVDASVDFLGDGGTRNVDDSKG